MVPLDHAAIGIQIHISLLLSEAYAKSKIPGRYCGRTVMITNNVSDSRALGRIVDATVADTCDSFTARALELLLAIWHALTGNAALGTVKIRCEFV